MSTNPESAPAFKIPLVLAVYLALAVVAGLVVAYATPHGLTIYSADGIAYVDGARNLMAGNGFSAGIPPEPATPVIHFPPLYSLLIAGAEIFNHRPYGAAWCANVICYAASVFMLCLLVWRATGGHLVAGLAAGLMFCFNPDLLLLFTGAWSETLFILLGVAGQAAVQEYLAEESPGWMICAALCLGLTAAARYSGVVWMAAGALTVLLCARGTWIRKFGKGVLFGVISFLPALAVSVRNRIVSHSVAGRSLGMHMISVHHIEDGLETVAGWFLPWRFGSWIYGAAVVVGLGVLMVAGWVFAYKQGSARGRAFWVLSVAFVGLYVAHLVLAISFVHYNTPVDDRLLAPVEVCAIACLAAWTAGGKTRALRMARGVVCALIVLVSLGRIWPVIEKSRVNSGGYRGPIWRRSSLATAVNRLPKNAALYSNKPEAIYLSTDRPVRAVPFEQDPMTLAANKNAPAEIKAMVADIQSTDGMLLYFAPVSTDVTYDKGVPLSRLHEFTEQELTGMGLNKVGQLNGVLLMKPAGQ